MFFSYCSAWELLISAVCFGWQKANAVYEIRCWAFGVLELSHVDSDCAINLIVKQLICPWFVGGAGCFKEGIQGSLLNCGFLTVVLSFSLYARGGFSATSSSFLSLLFFNFFYSAPLFFSNHTPNIMRSIFASCSSNQT